MLTILKLILILTLTLILILILMVRSWRKRCRLFQNSLVIALALLLILLNTGCWDKREIEDLAFLAAWGIDRQENGEFQASVIIVKPFAINRSAEGGGMETPERPFWLASSTGRTMLEAMCNFSAFSPRFLFCAHSRFLVFGEESAREGIGEMLDFFERNRETRLTAHLLVVKGITAADFLKSEYELAPLPPEGGQGMLQNAGKRLSMFVDVNINDFLIMLEEEGIEPIAGGFGIIPKRPAPLEGELQREKIIQSPIVCGTAAFKGDQLVGWLDLAETRGLQWIRGKVKNAPLVVENPADASYLLGIEVMRARSKLIPSLSAGKPRLQIKIELEGNIDDIQGYFNPGTDSTVLKKIENRMAEVVKKEIEAVLYRCQEELNTDIFGFGATFNRSFPREWEELKGDWEIEFPRLEISLEVAAHVKHSGLTMKSIKKAK